MSAKKTLLTLFLLFGFTLTNCETEEDSCPPFDGAFFDIQGIESVVHHYILSDNASPPLENNAVIPYDEYKGIILTYSVDYVSSRIKAKRFSGLGQLYARTCNQNGQAGSKNEMYTNITVITINDFNSQYSGGDTINDLIRVPAGVGLQQTLDAYINSLEAVNIEVPSLSLGLVESPTANPKFQVRVIIELSTGEIYSKESTTVEFND